MAFATIIDSGVVRASVAQWIERLFPEQKVGGSIPFRGTRYVQRENGEAVNLRVVSIVLAAIPFLVATGFLFALSVATGMDGLAVIIAFLFTCIGLAVMSGVAVVLAFLKKPPSGLDVPSRVVSIISLVMFAPPAVFAILFGIMAIVNQPVVNA